MAELPNNLFTDQIFQNLEGFSNGKMTKEQVLASSEKTLIAAMSTIEAARPVLTESEE